ncbi:serine/threonine-protein phosphatase 7 long form homolog [Gossypium arboreum]|uniref:serine/threonine-protein phosphatase 7 long form homolog n=1 Tax=Gossypium arboreum TaxID=29729 RepID=UPI000819413E|nr:serine/threonine-protein phosphatase 7 long form homolog [Gossypium arboreum]
MTGFGDVALIWRFDLRVNLIFALVGRWCTETYTFIMPCSECTITLEDVAMQLGLRVDGAVVTGRSNVLEPSVLSHRLLGRSPNNGERNFTCLTLAWLKANFKELSSTATEYEVIYSWGSAVLAALYYELCRATKHGASNMAGCLVLLQSWALYRMPFLAAVRHQPYSWPLIKRWATSPGIGASQTLIIYRQMIEAYAGEKFLWMPYSALNIATIIPQWVHAKAHMWCINMPVLNFSTVEWYNGDRVMR